MQPIVIVAVAAVAVTVVGLIAIRVFVKKKTTRLSAAAILIYEALVAVLFYVEVVLFERWWAVLVYAIFFTVVPIALRYVVTHSGVLKGASRQARPPVTAPGRTGAAASRGVSRPAARPAAPMSAATSATPAFTGKQLEHRPQILPQPQPQLQSQPQPQPQLQPQLQPQPQPRPQPLTTRPAAVPTSMSAQPTLAPKISTPTAPGVSPVPVTPAARPVPGPAPAPAPVSAPTPAQAVKALTFESCLARADKIKELGHSLVAAGLYRQSRALAATSKEEKKAYFAEVRCYLEGGDFATGQASAVALKSRYELSPVEQLKLDALLTLVKG